TTSWTLLGMNSTQTIGVLGIIMILAVTFLSSKGMNAIAKIGSLGGIFTIVVNVIFVVVSFIVLFANHFRLAAPIHGASTFITSPNPAFQTPIALISFVVYAVFAYGGMESLGSVTDNMDQPEKTFPRGLIIASLFTIGTYVLMIFMLGWSINYKGQMTSSSVNLGNVTYAVFNYLGLAMGNALGWSHAAAATFGVIMTRIVALAQAIGFLGALFILMYSPIKAFILGSDQ